MAVVNDGGSNPVTLGVSGNLNSTAVQNELAVLLAISDESLNLLQVLSRVGGADIEVLSTRADLKGLCLSNKLWNPCLSITDENDDGDSHATLASAAEAGTGKGVKSILLITVGHND